MLQVREVFEQTIMAEFVKHRKDLADPHLVLAYLTYVERVWVGKVRCYFEPGWRQLYVKWVCRQPVVAAISIL